MAAAEARVEAKKHEHYARLLKLPRLIDETLATWIDPTEDLSDKQIFHELLRMMGLVDAVEPRLMRAQCPRREKGSRQPRAHKGTGSLSRA